jgi:hypothetical protein
MKRLILISLFLSFLFPLLASPQTIIPGGPVSGSRLSRGDLGS